MKTEENKTNNPPAPSIARLLKEDFEKKKHQLATFLTTQSERLSPRTRKLVFLFAGIALGLTIMAISFNAVRGTSILDFIHHERVMPLQMDPSTGEEIVTPEEYQVMSSFSKTLDSLKQRDPFAYKKLMHAHPGLRDSMRLLMHIYQSTH